MNATRKLKAAPARQARSRKSEQRLLDAAEGLLEDRSMNKVAMQEIALAAGMSVGGLYARFPSKDALLMALHDRYEADRTRILNAAIGEAREHGDTAEERLLIFTRALVSLFRKRRGILRTFLLRHWADMEALPAEARDRLGSIYAGAYELLKSEFQDGDEGGATAVRFAVSVIMSTAREVIVLKPPTGPGAVRLSDDALARALARTALCALESAPGGRS